jgi:hypothetical protein
MQIQMMQTCGPIPLHMRTVTSTQTMEHDNSKQRLAST